jgi:DNA primase
MAFPDSFVDEVRRTADIVRYVSEQVALKKMGASWKGLCPFHNEKTPSFNVRSEPPIFHCFGCGEGGDVFKFVMLHEKVSFPEAVETVARRFGVSVPERTFDAGPGRKEREETLALLEEAALHFARNLWSAPGQQAREYLLSRGFKKQTLETIRAGAARESWSDLVDALRRRFSPAAIVGAGLAVERQGGGHYDRFRNRAIFPIPSDAGRIVGFGARSIDGSEPKYLNSPETAVYQKSRLLYGLSWAKDAIRRESRVVLMEGYLDVARAHESGIQEAVATCGTALTQSHARLLRRFAERVAVNFDQDDAGQRAVRKSLALLAEEGLDARIVELPAGHDPDSFLRAEGPAAYRERLDRAPRSMEWLIRRAAAENDVSTPPGKAAYLNALLPPLLALASAVERAAWIPMVVAHGGLDERAAREELSRALGGRRPAAPPAALGHPPGDRTVARPNAFFSPSSPGAPRASERRCSSYRSARSGRWHPPRSCERPGSSRPRERAWTRPLSRPSWRARTIDAGSRPWPPTIARSTHRLRRTASARSEAGRFGSGWRRSSETSPTPAGRPWTRCSERRTRSPVRSPAHDEDSRVKGDEAPWD